MTPAKAIVVMPRLNANDDSGLLAVWLKSAGDAIRRGDLIAQIETTKAAVDVEAPADGFLHPLVDAGTMVPVGDSIAWIVPIYDAGALAREVAAPRSGSPSTIKAGGRLVSRKAQELLHAAGLGVDDIPGDGPIGVAEVQARVARTRTAAASEDVIERLVVTENSVVLFGASDQGAVVADCLVAEGRYVPLCFVDDRPPGAEYLGLPVFDSGVLRQLFRRGARLAHVCIGDPRSKIRVAQDLASIGFTMVRAVHPRAMVSPSARLGDGVFVGPGVVIGPHAVIGDFCQVNNNATVPHHVRLGVGVRVSDGANIAGGVTVGDRAYLGLGITINTGCTIGEDVTIVSGVSVFASVPNGTIVRPHKTRV